MKAPLAPLPFTSALSRKARTPSALAWQVAYNAGKDADAINAKGNIARADARAHARTCKAIAGGRPGSTCATLNGGKLPAGQVSRLVFQGSNGASFKSRLNDLLCKRDRAQWGGKALTKSESKELARLMKA